MVMPNVRLSFLCVFVPFSRRKFIHIFTAEFQLCYGRRLHKSSSGLTQLYRALGTGRGGVGETVHGGVFTGARFSCLPVGRDEKRAPLKTPSYPVSPTPPRPVPKALYSRVSPGEDMCRRL